MAHFARLAAALDQAEDAEPHLEDMLTAIEGAKHDALLATALAMRAYTPTHDEHEWAAASSDLARAVALLDDGNGDPVDRPMAYTSCGLSYHTRGLWELALEMHDLAAEALAGVSPAYARIAELTRRVVVLNQYESVVPRPALWPRSAPARRPAHSPADAPQRGRRSLADHAPVVGGRRPHWTT